MQWSRRSTREACEQVVLEVVERMGIEAAFDDCRNGTIDFDIERGRVLRRTTGIDRRVVGFEGPESSVRYKSSLEERLVEKK